MCTVFERISSPKSINIYSPGQGVKNIIINTVVVWFPIDLTRILKVMDVVPERLLVPGKFLISSIFSEFHFQNMVNWQHAEIFPLFFSRILIIVLRKGFASKVLGFDSLEPGA